jgi:phosphoribosylformylglycinamidine synthase
MVEVLESPSLFFAGMTGARLPIAVAHGEGCPFKPNGSAGGLTAVTTADGCFTAMMPHPARVTQRADELERRRRERTQPVEAAVTQCA